MQCRPQVVENSHAATAHGIGTKPSWEIDIMGNGEWMMASEMAVTSSHQPQQSSITCWRAPMLLESEADVCVGVTIDHESSCVQIGSLCAFLTCCESSYTLQQRRKKPWSGVTHFLSGILCCVADVQKHLLVTFSHRWWVKSVQIGDTDTCLTVVWAFFF